MEKEHQSDALRIASEREKHVTMIANFIVDKNMESSHVVSTLQERLGSAGVLSYQIEVTGSAGPELELDGATYFGEAEMERGVDSYINKNPKP